MRKQGKWEQAIKEFKKVLNVAKDTEIIHYNIGMAYMQGNRFWDAHDAFEKAMKINGRPAADYLHSKLHVMCNSGLSFRSKNR
ncbi:MAG: tetratricopeptide repeat protein [Fidelibacterota bacterium]